MDDNGHETHCSGIIAAELNGKAVVGVAPQADLYAYKVLKSRKWHNKQHNCWHTSALSANVQVIS